MPSKLRHQLGGELFLSLGFEKTIELRTKEDFDQWKDSLLKSPTTNIHTRNMQRAVLGNTYEVLMDKQGRINIPVHLLRNTPIKKDVVVVGMFNRIEIWDQKAWDKFMTEVGSGLLEQAAAELDKKENS